MHHLPTLPLVAAALFAAVPGVPAITLDPVEGTYPQPSVTARFDQTHSTLDGILRQHVTPEARVKYNSLRQNPVPLASYLAEVSAVTASEFDGWSKEQQLALLINLYNAATLQLVIDHYPISSIKKIGGVFKGPWKQPVVKLFGKLITLDTLEHGVLRTQYGEPRIHFAIVCAAMGCPPLRAGAYSADRLDAQLDEQGRRFLGDTAKNRVDASKKTLRLSPIFKWFKEDFTKGGNLTDFVKPYFPPAAAASIGGDFDFKYTDYDWSLNSAD